MARKVLTSYAGGEISPSLHHRIDLAKVAVGAKTMRNCYNTSQGEVDSRSGTMVVAEVKDSTKAVRIIGFAFNKEQTYTLEFGEQYMRVHKDGAVVTELDKTITGITQANPAVVTSSAHSYSNGDQVYINSVVGMTELNGKRFTVANVTATTFELTGIDSTAYTAYSSGGVANKVYEIVTPYLEADLFLIKYTQSADTLTLNCAGYDERTITRTGHTAWTITITTFEPNVTAPTSPNITNVGTSGAATYKYRITTTEAETFEESLPVDVQTTTGHATLDDTNYNQIDWTAPAGFTVEKYNVYKFENGIYGFLGSTETTQYLDQTAVLPDLSDTPPKARNPFSGTNYPEACGYFEQRLWRGRIQKLEGSTISNFDNMSRSSPVKANDAVSAKMNAEQVNDIRHFVAVNELLALTSGAEWKISSADGGSITSSSLVVRRQSAHGASHVRPIVSGTSILYVQDGGEVVRDLGYKLASDVYDGDELSVLAHHLFDGKQIVDWAHAKRPYGIIWAVMDDGTMTGMTYKREHDVWSWHRHDTAFGDVESVCAISEGNEDALYLVVKRDIDGTDVRFIERMHDRHFATAEDAFTVDCGLTYYNPITISGVTQANPVVVTATGHGLSNDDVVDIRDIIAGLVKDPVVPPEDTSMETLNHRRYKIANVTANTFELTAEYSGVDIDGTGFTTYKKGGTVAKTVDTISGLHHLEGMTVSVLANGGDDSGKVVTDGAITLTHEASWIHIGLPITSQFEPLYFDMGADTPTTVGLKKRISQLAFRVRNTKGLKVGNTSDNVKDLRVTPEQFEKSWLLRDETIPFNLIGNWQRDPSIFFEQTDPVPFTIQSISFEVIIGGA